jgi:hypothetical protein
LIGFFILKVDGSVKTISGHPEHRGYRDGVASQAQFNSPTGIVVDRSDGSIYVSEFYGNQIRKIFKVYWNKENHHQFPEPTKRSISTIMKSTIRRGSIFSRVPRDVLFIIFHFLSSFTDETGNDLLNESDPKKRRID